MPGPLMMEDHERTIAVLETDVRLKTAQKDAAYIERNRMVAGFAALAVKLGYRAGRRCTDIAGWDEEWSWAVFIDLPTGQVSWHYHRDEAPLFSFLGDYDEPWDGHDTPEKYRRVAALAET
jgi:hypothetical protein